MSFYESETKCIALASNFPQLQSYEVMAYGRFCNHITICELIRETDAAAMLSRMFCKVHHPTELKCLLRVIYPVVGEERLSGFETFFPYCVCRWSLKKSVDEGQSFLVAYLTKAPWITHTTAYISQYVPTSIKISGGNPQGEGTISRS